MRRAKGSLSLLEGLVTRLAGEPGAPVTTMPTGGRTPLFDRDARMFAACEPDLTLIGLCLLARRGDGGFASVPDLASPGGKAGACR